MCGNRCKNIKSREGGLTALEGDLRKALGRSFLRWEKDNVKGTKASVAGYWDAWLRKLSRKLPADLINGPVPDCW